MKPPATIETPIEGLYASSPEALPFAPSIDIRAFLLRRERGNLLLYSVSRRSMPTWSRTSAASRAST
jgi:hypothetical protein